MATAANRPAEDERIERAIAELGKRISTRVEISLKHRDVEFRDADGRAVALSRIRFRNLLFELGQQCRCGMGQRSRITLEPPNVVLGCDRCSHTVRYRAPRFRPETETTAV